MISTYLAEDHRRLEDALSRATGHGGIDLKAYAEFRGGDVLRHIGLRRRSCSLQRSLCWAGRPFRLLRSCI